MTLTKKIPGRKLCKKITLDQLAQRYHINKFPHTEWSGFLFYDYEGSFEENNLVFKARDFVVLDIGSSGQTSFADCPKVCTYAIDHDLLDCKEALIH